MSIQDRKIREKERLRKKILNAVEKIFVKEGYEKISMRKIAGKIDYSPTTIYRFFKNKKELLKALLTGTYEEVSELYENIKANQSLSPFETLEALIRIYIQYFLENPNAFELFTGICKIEMEEDDMYEIIEGKRYKINYSWRQCLEKLSRQNVLRSSDINSILFFIWHSTHGFISNRITHPGLPWKTNEEEIKNLLNMIFTGIINPKQPPITKE